MRTTFKTRTNTIFIGEKSGGLMTANHLYQMPFGENILPMGILLVLAEAYETDRAGNHLNFISPDIEIFEGDNFDDLTKYLKILKAIECISN